MTTNNTTAPKLELRNVKHAEFASQETNCFEAVLYVDGQRFAHVENEGHGGADHFTPANKGQNYGAFRVALAALALRINPLAVATYAEIPASEDAEDDAEHEIDLARDYFKRGVHTYDSVMEGAVGQLLADWLTAKDLKRLLGRKLVVRCKDGKLLTWSSTNPEAKKNPLLILPGVRATCEKRENPITDVLNALPFEQAVEIYRAAAQ